MQFFVVQVSILKHKTQCARASEEHVRANFLKPNHKGTARRTQCSSEQSKGQTQCARSSEAQVRANFLKPNHINLMPPPTCTRFRVCFAQPKPTNTQNQRMCTPSKTCVFTHHPLSKPYQFDVAPNLYALPSLFCTARADKHRNQETHAHAIKNMCFHTSPFI